MHPDAIRFIYFDLDDTLLDHRHAERSGLAEVYQHHLAHFSAVSLDEVQATYHRHSVPLWRRYAHGEIGKDDVQRLRFAHLLDALRLHGLEPEALNTLYLRCYARHWTLVAEARTAFHALADRFPVGILTNGFAEIQHAKFARFPELRDRATAVVISEEVGVMKPHAAIFAHAAKLAQTAPEAILYVGDSYTSDVEGARGAGWQAAWYTSSTEADAPGEVFRFEAWSRLTAHLLG